METIAIIVMLAGIVAIMSRGMRSPEQPSVMIIQVEQPRHQSEGCLPFVIILVVSILISMLISH